MQTVLLLDIADTLIPPPDLNDGFLPPPFFIIFYIYFFSFFFSITEELRKGLRARTQGAERSLLSEPPGGLIYYRGAHSCAKKKLPPPPQEIGSQGGVYDLSPVPSSQRYRI